MADETFTRCPSCATVYRVTREQLATRNGQVRCGQCKTIFDGVAQQIIHMPPEDADLTEDAETENVLEGRGDPATDIEDSPGLAATAQPAEAELPPPAVASSEPDPAPSDAFAATTLEERLAGPRPPRVSGAKAFAYTLAVLLLLTALSAQALYHFRDSIVAHWPASRPVLARLCDMARCSLHPLRDGDMRHLSIEASDLQADTAHRGLLILTATLRNRASWAVAYPYLELTLTDAQDRVVVRRALTPADYAGGTADVQRGIASNAEVSVKVFVDASATAQAGYRLYMFYP